MPLTSWDDPIKPGCYHAKVIRCEEKKSKAGDMAFVATFAQVGGDTLCDDWIMQSGPGKKSGISKLSALGFTAADLPIHADQLVSKEVYIDLVQQESSHNGKTYSDIKVARGGRAPNSGYWPKSSPPTGDVVIMAIPAPPADLGVPF